MNIILFLIIATIFLNGCFQVLALVGPGVTGVATGKAYQSAISYSVSYGVQKSTGKTIIENIIDSTKNSKHKELVVDGKKNGDLVSSLNPYPDNFKIH